VPPSISSREHDDDLKGPRLLEFSGQGGAPSLRRLTNNRNNHSDRVSARLMMKQTQTLGGVSGLLEECSGAETFDDRSSKPLPIRFSLGPRPPQIQIPQLSNGRDRGPGLSSQTIVGTSSEGI